MTNRIIKKVLSALSHQALVRVMSVLFFSLALIDLRLKTDPI